MHGATDPARTPRHWAMQRLTTGVIVALLLCAATGRAQSLPDSLIPSAATNCRVASPPAGAGLAVTPGGFLLVFPRNEAIGEHYTGCKLLWIVDTDRTPRLATLYFERGELTRAVAHDVRDPAGAITGACAFPAARSLLPTTGARFTDSACAGVTQESLYALRLPTLPRSCLTTPDAPVCKEDPR